MTVYSPMLGRAARPVARKVLCAFMLCNLAVAVPFGYASPVSAVDALSPPTLAGAASPVMLAGGTERYILGVEQDLIPFARKSGQDSLLLSPAEQAERDARSNQLFFSPWQQARPSLSAKEFRAHIIRKPRGYCMDVPWSAERWQSLVQNVNAAAYPLAKGPAIVTRHADMRSMPTDKPLFMEGTAAPTVDYFDFFQHSSLALGTPVYVSHASTDGKWLYVEYPLLSGWVRAADVALVSRVDARAYAKGPFGVVVRDGTLLAPSTTGSAAVKDAAPALGLTYIGSVFPYADAAREDIMFPLRNSDGTARMERVHPPQGSVLPKPLPLTPAAVAALGTQMLGQPYGWGGITHNRDCSLAMRDLFLPFGIWLARNSRTQVQVRGFRKLAAQSPAERKATILREGVPFMTLLGFPGHVGLYVGAQDGEPIMLHNILGLRTANAEQNFRYIIAKGILSTLEPGKDQPELQVSETLLERLRAMRRLP